ncbi:MAG TPA: sulfotransferase family 2 domain-containing protein [Chloroflexota bacterium]|nr:sulfotransferase family 2 domain-containing protein [Chloroflexota bacterium]HUM71665.1 sulfotransferase family 2 domain-containing protein [Chloroflexota bacterium]
MISSPPQTVIFLHIPKTAGTTLYHLLGRQFPPGHFYIMPNVPQNLPHFQALPPEQKAPIYLIAGHFSYGIHQYLPQPATYFTILRQPRDLVISYFYYLRNSVAHPHFHLAKSMSLPEFIENRIDLNMSNMQTRMLAGRPSYGDYYECTPDDLEAAKENLRQSFTVVGLTERFDETLLLLQKAFGWQNLYYARMNVTRKKPSHSDLSSDVMQSIAQVNQLDEALYRFAATLFADQVAQQSPDFNKQVLAFQRRNQWLYPFRYSIWQARRQSWLWRHNASFLVHDLYVRARNRLL